MIIEPTTISAPRLHQSNNLDLMRLSFAVLVLLGHSFELIDGNRHREPLTIVFHTISLGELAVDFFFILSGFLITASWDRQPQLISFLRKRVFRIYPGFIAAYLVSILLVGAIGSSDPVVYLHELSLRHIVKQLIILSSPDTPITFGGSNYAVVNGALWTIQFEFVCYLSVLALGMIGLLRYRQPVVIIWITSLLLFLAFRLHAATPDNPGSIMGNLPSYIRFIPMFFSGAVFYKLDLVRKTKLVSPTICALAVLAVGLFFPVMAEIAVATAGSYLVFVMGFARFGHPALSRLPDISYGVYLYGWPVQKLVIYAGASEPMVVFGLSLIATIVIAVLSWRFVEGPALRLSRLHILQPAPGL